MKGCWVVTQLASTYILGKVVIAVQTQALAYDRAKGASDASSLSPVP
jgi:hypothetical protein